MIAPLLYRYLAAAVLLGTLATLAVLMPLMAFFLLAEEMGAVDGVRYGVGQAFLVMLLSLPGYLYQLFPIATLIGALAGLGTLASRSELVAMRAAGMSVRQILAGAMLGGLVLAGLGFVLGEWLAPRAGQLAIEWRHAALSEGVAQQTPGGFWAIDDATYVNIRAIQSPTRLLDIAFYAVDREQGTLVATQAASASYQDGSWHLQDIQRSRVGPLGVEVEQLPHAAWASLLDPELLKIVLVDPRGLAVWDLFKYLRFMAINQQEAGPYEVAFWSKVLHPLLTLSMIFVAIPILVGSTRTAGIGRQLLAGVLIGLLYYLISRGFGFLALLYEFSSLLSVAAPPLLFMTVGLLLLRRAG